MQEKQIVFISNSFGFGPTAKLFPIMEIFHGKFNYPLNFLTGDVKSQIIHKNYLNIAQIDERNVEEIKLKLSEFKNPYVISSLNRFALQACNNLNIPCVFIDGLTWMWKSIPKEYLQADMYYALNFPGVDQKLIQRNNIKKTQYILDVKNLERKFKRGNFILFQIGGFKNPLYNSSENFYLQILSKFINTIQGERIVITGGRDALEFLKDRTTSQEITFETADKDHFHDLLLNCKHLVTTSGLTTSLEAFYSNTPTTFLLPSNLSQFRILEIFKNNNVSDSNINWDEFFEVNLDDMDERTGLEHLDNLASHLLSDQERMSYFINKMTKLIQNIPSIDNANLFINKIGVNGAVEIVEDLIKLWKL